jgi:hypothetical protein
LNGFAVVIVPNPVRVLCGGEQRHNEKAGKRKGRNFHAMFRRE